jgi:hypothetical protein
LKKPSVPINSHSVNVPRLPGPERKTYRVNATLVKMKKESDGDIHVVIADPGPNGKRMVVEFPNTDCARPHSRAAARLSAGTSEGGPRSDYRTRPVVKRRNSARRDPFCSLLNAPKRLGL